MFLRNLRTHVNVIPSIWGSSNPPNSEPSTATLSIILLYIYGILLVSSVTYCYEPYECVNQSLTDNDIYINGYKSAFGPQTSMTVTTGPSACSGSYSCALMQFLRIQGSNSYSHTCSGSHSCSNTTIISNTTKIVCSGTQSCVFSNIISTDISTLDCYGYGSCKYSHIVSIEQINVDGAYALYGATIDTENSSNNGIDITLYGDYAGYGATLSCREGHQCNIYCKVYTSCFMLFVECNGDCNIYMQSQDNISPITNIALFQTPSEHIVFKFGAIALSNDEACNAEHNQGLICCRGTSSSRGGK